MTHRLLRITTAPISIRILLEGQLEFMTRNGFEVLAVSADGPEVQSIVRSGVAHRIVALTREITPLTDLFCLVQLIRIIRRFKPHIVHTHTPKAGLLGMMAAWICRVPVRIHTVAGLPIMVARGWKKQLLRITERITYACAHRVYPNSVGLLDYMRQLLHIDDGTGKLHIIGNGSSNGIDTNHFARTPALENEAMKIRQQIGGSGAKFVFVFLGRIVKDKGIVELSAAFREVSARLPARLLMIGDYEGDLDPLPPETKKFLAGSPDVIHAGFQDDVRPWLIASDVFVFPSHREGFPNAVLQAASLEVPCIVSDINGCNEIISHEATGLVVPPNDVRALAAAMLRMAEESGSRKSMSSAARESVVRLYERKHVWQELRAEYRRLLNLQAL